MGGSEQDNSLQINTVKVQYQVKAGDSLSDIALKVTGDMRNWRKLAAYNKISNPKTLNVGQIIGIPSELLDGILSTDNRVADARATQTITNAGKPLTRLPVTTGSGVSIARPTAALDQGSADVAIFPVSINRSFDLVPFDPVSGEGRGALRYGSQAPQIRVLGTYYPKGVYTQPVTYATLLSRVSPGTVFELEGVVNDWYKVITDNGIGYIRQSDSTLLQ